MSLSLNTFGLLWILRYGHEALYYEQIDWPNGQTCMECCHACAA